MCRGPSRGPCIGSIYTYSSRVGGIQQLFPSLPVPHCCRRVNFARQILINRNVSGMFTYSMLLCYTNDLIYFSNSLSLSFFHSLKPIILQLHVKELNYVLDQNKKPKDDEDSVHSSPMLGATRKFFPLFLFNSALYASNLL